MSKFKVGDEVRIVKAVLSSQEDLIGSTFIIKKASLGGYCDNMGSPWLEHELELVSRVKTWDNLSEGDFIKCGNDKRKVLGVLNGIVFFSTCFNFELISGFQTKKELQSEGYTIIQDEQVEQAEELTMEQVCKELGREVKIKK